MALYHYQAITAPVGIVAETPTLGWLPEGVRQIPVIHRPIREQLLQSPFELLAPVHEWGWTERQRPELQKLQRDNTAQPISTVLDAPSIDQWAPGEPQYVVRQRVQREQLVWPIAVVPSPAGDVSWLPLDRARRRAVPVRQQTIQDGSLFLLPPPPIRITIFGSISAAPVIRMASVSVEPRIEGSAVVVSGKMTAAQLLVRGKIAGGSSSVQPRITATSLEVDIWDV